MEKRHKRHAAKDVEQVESVAPSVTVTAATGGGSRLLVRPDIAKPFLNWSD